MSTAIRFPVPPERDPVALTEHIAFLETELDTANRTSREGADQKSLVVRRAALSRAITDLRDDFPDDRDGGRNCPCNNHPSPCERCRAEFDAYREDRVRTESRLETELRWSLAFAALRARLEAVEKKVKEQSLMVPA